jgi:hypothetical protein
VELPGLLVFPRFVLLLVLFLLRRWLRVAFAPVFVLSFVPVTPLLVFMLPLWPVVPV